MNQRIQAAYEKRPKDWVYNLVTAIIVVGLLVWSGSAVETSGSTQDGGQIALNVLSGIFHPDLEFLFDFSTKGVPYLMLETVCIAFLGTIVGAIISIPHRFCGQNPYHDGTYHPGFRLRSYVHPCNRPRSFCRSFDHGRMLNRYDKQDVH